MKPKIVIADDGPTIQKVIKITLSNEDFELIECLKAEDLSKIVKEHQPNLVLLDFNLSENKTGYDLAREIKAICQPKILMLYGTYDSVNEALFDESGINAHIIKPFDGSKFINYCRNLVEDSKLEHSDEDFSKQDEFLNSNDHSEIEVEDEWVVNQPNLADEEDEYHTADVVSVDELNHLQKGIEDWGIDIPGVIDQNESSQELPPIIASKNVDKVEPIVKVDQSEENLIPIEEDLEYPEEIEIEVKAPISLSSRLVSLDELKETNDDEAIEEDDYSANGISLDDTLGTNSSEEIADIEAQIADEYDEKFTEEDIKDYKVENLWDVDEVVEDPDIDLISSIEFEDENIDDDINHSFEEENEHEFIDREEEQAANISDIKISSDLIEEKLNEILGPMIEKLIQEKIDKAVEKIAWEVIPDLAENLIRKELSNLSNEVLNQIDN